jgi:hypothetical protein
MNSTQLLFGSHVYAIAPKVLVILPSPWNLTSAEDKHQLNRLLEFYRIRPESTRIISSASLSVEELTTQSSEKIIVFGVPMAPVWPLGEIQKINEKSIVYSCLLSDLKSLEASRKKVLQDAFKLLLS